jgi:hypothetical protein
VFLGIDTSYRNDLDMDEEIETTKKIMMNLGKTYKKNENDRMNRMIQLGYDKKDRVIVDTKRWTKHVVDITYQDPKVQIEYLNNEGPLVRSQIQDKIRGYKYQDQLKNILDENFLVDYPYVYDLLCKSKLKCFYCHIDCMILYSHVRESKQWTLDRMDNSIGHNRGNVEITCLDCNLRRGTKNFERYLETKRLNNIRKICTEEDEEKII